MNKNNTHPIRLRYSAIINYISVIYRIMTGIIFIIIISRKLTIEEFGLWGIILSLSYMISTPIILWGYWAQREFARGIEKSGGTGFVLTTSYMIIAIFIYVALSIIESRILHWGLNYLILSLPILIFNIYDMYFVYMAEVVKPELIGYKGFVFHTSRLILIVVFLLVMGYGFTGVIYSVIFTHLLTVSYMAYNLIKFNALGFSFELNLVKKWLYLSPLPIVETAYHFLRNGLRAFSSWITGSEIPAAYLNVAFAMEEPIVKSARSVIPALYAQTLKKPVSTDLEESLRINIFFITFISATLFVLSKPIISLYNPIYVEGESVVKLIVLYGILFSFASIYYTIIKGLSRIDLNEELELKNIFSSSLFKATLYRVFSVLLAYIIGGLLCVTIRGDITKVADYFVVGLIIGWLPFLFKYIQEVKTILPYKFPVDMLIKTLFSSSTMIIFYYLVDAPNMIVSSFWQKAPLLALYIIIGFTIYILQLYWLDNWVKDLFRKFLLLAKGRIK